MISLLSTAGLSLTLLSTAHAAPRSLLNRRMAINYVGCSDDQKTRLSTGFADAAALANIAYNMDRTSTAFTHYLRDEDGDYANDFWSMIAANNDPTNAPYTFSVRCAASCTGGQAQSLAITDSEPQLNDGSYREMKICPLFFTAANTQNNLDSKKYDGDKRGSWCQKGQHFINFETAGHTLLHEMTHLDALAKAAGLPEHTDPTGLTTHATDDLDPADYGADYTVAARAFLTDWVENPDSFPAAALKPYQNAENIAAAATEHWFLKSCGFVDISL